MTVDRHEGGIHWVPPFCFAGPSLRSEQFFRIPGIDEDAHPATPFALVSVYGRRNAELPATDLSDAPKPFTIISGGETGVSRAALDWASYKGIPHGGWCPKGRLAEDGVIPPYYNLKETSTRGHKACTVLNVRQSDATLLISHSNGLTGGSLITYFTAITEEKPCMHLNSKISKAASRLARFVEVNQVKKLHVAGPRASEEPQAELFTLNLLQEACHIGGWLQ